MSFSRVLELTGDFGLSRALDVARGLDPARLLDAGFALAPGGAAIDPMHQFEVSRWAPISVGGLDISFTNASFFMLLTAMVILGFMAVALSKRALVPGRMQSVAELSYGFVASMVRDNLGESGMKFFPFVFTIFIFIFVSNLVGLVPGFFTTTSQLIVTLVLGLMVVLTVVVVGLVKHGFGFLRIFAPSGLPIWMYPLLVPIEIITFLSRPFSLAIRLFANMLAGHILLKLFGGFVIALASIGAVGVAASILPLAANVAITALEFMVAFLQAYVFAVLTCIYLNDALHPGH